MAHKRNAESIIKSIAHVGIRVHSLERSRAFYELFGFKFIMGPVGPEPVAMMKHPNGIEINLVLNAKDPNATNILMDVPEKHPGYTHAALEVDSLDDIMAVIKDADIPLSGGPVDYPFGARGCFIRDPDRNTLEFFQPAPPKQ
mmetsp:Transcript_114196/g.160207  ORF Transcript_114196/g.160207 Transcript_114196/m.160207 type:complete len:143 (+) Transcript_114196:132-560(+)